MRNCDPVKGRGVRNIESSWQIERFWKSDSQQEYVVPNFGGKIDGWL